MRERLTHCVASVWPAYPPDRREDLVQRALLRLIRLHEKWGESKGPPPPSYVWKVAYSVTIDEIRRVRRRLLVSLPGEGAVQDRACETSPEADRTFAEMGEALRECLSRLSENRRLAVGMRLLGHRVEELMRLFDWPEKKVRNLVFRGFSDLRVCLQRKGYEP